MYLVLCVFCRPVQQASMMQVITIPNQDDNYAYLLVNESTKHAAAIDPAQPDKVFAAAEKAGVTIKT